MNHASFAPSPPGTTGWVVPHWRGELPLLSSVWWRFILPFALVDISIGALVTWINLEGSHLQAASVALLMLWPLLVVSLVWGGVGVWRAAGAYARSGGALLWAGAARAATLGAALRVLAALTVSLVPQFGSWLSLAQGVDSIGTPQVEVAPDGRRLRIQGPLGQGVGDRVSQALGSAPGVYLLEVVSSGGRHAEAVVIASLVQARKLQTRVVGACDNACLQIFMAGHGRQVMPAGHLSLHRLASGAASPLFDALARRWQTAKLRRAGLPESAVIHTLGLSAANPWVLQTDELLAGGFIGLPGRPLDVELPPRDGAQPPEYAEALTSSPEWRAFETYRPGVIATAARLMSEARLQGASDDETQIAAQRVIEAMLPGLVRDAGPALREQYVELFRGQIEAAKVAGVAACRGVLKGDAEARRALGAPFPAREAEWLLSAAAEPAHAPPRPLTALESEVVRKAVGEQAAAVLGAIRRTPRNGGAWSSECDRATALIAEVMALPAPERRLAIRLMFAIN